MNAFTPIHASDASVPVAYPARGMVERQLEVLGRLAEAGLALAVGLEQQVAARQDMGQAGAAPVGGVDIGLSYSRIARAVRLTLALQSKLMRELGEREAADAAAETARADDAEAQAARDEARSRHHHADRVGRIVRRVIAAEHDEADEAGEALDGEAEERLADPDIYGDILERPLSELVALICRDLGLDPDWDRLAEEAWAQAEIAAAPPGSPFAARAGPSHPP